MSLKFKQTCLYFSPLAVFLLFFQVGTAQYNFEAVDALLEKNRKNWGSNIVALVWKDGQIVYKKEIGKDFTAKEAVNVGASGQWITAAAAMAVVSDGKLTLESTAGKSIPILTKYMKAYINLRHCLTHTTGLEPEKTGVGKLLPKSKFNSLEEEVDFFATKRNIVTNPQTEFYYSEVGMNIAGRMLEVANNRKTFERIVQEKITRPLKMRFTTFYNYNSLHINPSSGMQTTATDYLNFLVMLLQNGQFEGKQILSEDAIKEMETAQFTDLPVKFMPAGLHQYHYGLGAWLIEEDADKRGTIITCPSLNGTWPYIDRKRNYAAILLVKPQSTDQNTDTFMQFKTAVDLALGQP